MKRQQEYEISKEYIRAEGLEQLLDFQQHADYEEGTFDTVSDALDIPFPPEAGDLVRIHQLIRSRKCFTVLEMGLGFSTVIIADALAKNQADWEALEHTPEIRNRFMFQLFSVDSSVEWIEVCKQRFPELLRDRVHFHHSEVEIGTFQGQLCHYYSQLPDIVPDFIYMDGPSPKDVKGTLNGLSFQCDERTVMAGDLLLMEPVLLPGTFILVDGRTNNARFMERNFTRPFEVNWDRKGDVTTFELTEERLGPHNHLGADFFA